MGRWTSFARHHAYLTPHPHPHTHTLSPLSYGFDYLVLPIMEQGGFRVFREMFSTGGDEPPRAEDTGGLALGQ